MSNDGVAEGDDVAVVDLGDVFELDHGVESARVPPDPAWARYQRALADRSRRDDRGVTLADAALARCQRR